MCGICGVIGKEISTDIVSAVSRMNDAQKLRGPDDEGVFKKENIIFGHRRLSIIDPSSQGHQPMQLGNDLVITFNGEIYNFEELKKELILKGFDFKTKSDTEVILAGYKIHGVKFFFELRGMYAFALWDEVKKKLFLVRDRYGIKPLYYIKVGENVVFASTVKAIEKSGIVSLTKNVDANIYFLTFGSIPLPLTTYNEVLAVRAGHFLEIDIEGEVSETKYYDSFSPFLRKTRDSYDTAVKEVKKILKESVRLHLISDAPLGIFLSGGLDSSALAAIASQMREKSITTLGIDFKEKEFSELKYREEVVSRIKSKHKEITVTKEDFEEEKENIFEAMDQPSIDGVNTYFVSRAAKQVGLKTVLSGLGSDEVFMGYHYFKKIKFIRLIQKFLPGVFFELLPKNGKMGRLHWLKRKHPFYSYIALRSIFSPAEVAKVSKVDKSRVLIAIEKLFSSFPSESELKKLSAPDLQSYFELSFYMSNQLLKDADFMSMAHSIEVRVPFLDHILVEYVSSLPAKIKLKGKYPKQLLIDVVSDLLPSSVWERPKMGFTFPFEKWLTGQLLITDCKLPITKFHWAQNWAVEVLKKLS